MLAWYNYAFVEGGSRAGFLNSVLAGPRVRCWCAARPSGRAVLRGSSRWNCSIDVGGLSFSLLRRSFVQSGGGQGCGGKAGREFSKKDISPGSISSIR